MTFPTCPPTPCSTPCANQTELYFGWYSDAIQQLRIDHPTLHVYKGHTIPSPPFTYWLQGDRKVLVTEVTHTSIPTPRQIKNGDIYLGLLDKYWGRTYTSVK